QSKHLDKIQTSYNLEQKLPLNKGNLFLIVMVSGWSEDGTGSKTMNSILFTLFTLIKLKNHGDIIIYVFIIIYPFHSFIEFFERGYRSIGTGYVLKTRIAHYHFML
ncbi:hypothetical protein ACJX0J_033489, partial [Zea mays]